MALLGTIWPQYCDLKPLTMLAMVGSAPFWSRDFIASKLPSLAEMMRAVFPSCMLHKREIECKWVTHVHTFTCVCARVKWVHDKEWKANIGAWGNDYNSGNPISNYAIYIPVLWCPWKSWGSQIQIQHLGGCILQPSAVQSLRAAMHTSRCKNINKRGKKTTRIIIFFCINHRGQSEDYCQSQVWFNNRPGWEGLGLLSTSEVSLQL